MTLPNGAPYTIHLVVYLSHCTYTHTYFPLHDARYTPCTQRCTKCSAYIVSRTLRTALSPKRLSSTRVASVAFVLKRASKSQVQHVSAFPERNADHLEFA